MRRRGRRRRSGRRGVSLAYIRCRYVYSISGQQEIVALVHVADLFFQPKRRLQFFIAQIHNTLLPPLFLISIVFDIVLLSLCLCGWLFMCVFHVILVSLRCLYLLLSLLRILFFFSLACVCATYGYNVCVCVCVCVFRIFFQSVLFKSTILFVFR